MGSKAADVILPPHAKTIDVTKTTLIYACYIKPIHQKSHKIHTKYGINNVVEVISVLKVHKFSFDDKV